MLSIYKELIQNRIDNIISLSLKISKEIEIDKQFVNRGNLWSNLYELRVNTKYIEEILSAEEGRDNEH